MQGIVDRIEGNIVVIEFNDKNISFRFNIDSNLPDSLYGDNINLKNVLMFE